LEILRLSEFSFLAYAKKGRFNTIYVQQGTRRLVRDQYPAHYY
jgi:hypothetical protein